MKRNSRQIGDYNDIRQRLLPQYTEAHLKADIFGLIFASGSFCLKHSALK